jgi:hypothetical protein
MRFTENLDDSQIKWMMTSKTEIYELIFIDRAIF